MRSEKCFVPRVPSVGALAPWLVALILSASGCTGGGRTGGGGDGGGALDFAGLFDAGPTDFATSNADAAIVERFYAHSKDTLYLVDPNTFDLTTIGKFGGTQSMTDLAVTANGEVFTISTDTLYQVDPATGKATKVTAASSATYTVGLTFQTDGTLLSADKDGTVRSVNTSTGAATTVGSYGGGFNTAGDLVVVADGTMFGISETGPGATLTSNVLIKVNPQTGVATGVGPIGYSGVFGIAFSQGNVIAFTDGGEIIKIDPATGVGTLVKTHAGVSFWGAGSNPLQPIS